MSSFENLIDNGSNKCAVFCSRCPSKILNSGMAVYCDNTFKLPFMQQKGEGNSDEEEITGSWQVSEIYTFENLGFSNTVNNLKYLICADCEIGPIGFHDLSTKQSYVALARMTQVVLSDACCFCEVFKVNPSSLLIEFDKVEETLEKFIFVKNISDEPQTLFINSPFTPYFSADFRIPHGLVHPGKDVRITIRLQSNVESRPYYDRLQIFCKKRCGQIIKLAASPKNESFINIPSKINLGCVPLGEKATAKITIPPMQKAVPFVFLPNTCNLCFTITPMKGVVNDTPVSVEISYTPEAYITVNYPIHIYLPTLLSTPFFLTVIADTKPGYPGKLTCNNDVIIGKQRDIKKLNHKKVKALQDVPKGQRQHVSEENISWSHHKTNLFLLEKDPKRLKDVELQGSSSDIEEQKKKDQQTFLKEVEEIRKLLSSGKYLKKDIIIDQSVTEKDNYIYNDCQISDDYQPFGEHSEALFSSHYPAPFKGRIIKQRRAFEPVFEFTERKGNQWLLKQLILQKFINAAKSVCIQCRLMKRLEILKMVRSYKKKTDRVSIDEEATMSAIHAVHNGMKVKTAAEQYNEKRGQP